MSALRLVQNPQSVEVWQGEKALLFRYQVEPDTPANESPRPYVHPLYSVDGDILTNHRPNDHPWHHGLSLTLTSVDGTNFWGGPSFRAGEGYRWREDHGRQVHVEWRQLEPGHLEHVVEWRDPQGAALLREERLLQPVLRSDGWSLAWRSTLRNVSGRSLTCHNYHSGGGLAGSHYTGLQFRGARALLDEHGDDTIKVLGEGEAQGEAGTHGQWGRWHEWQAQHDTTLRRTRVRFAVSNRSVCWFVRRSLPLVAFALHEDEPLVLGPADALSLEHQMDFLRS